MRPAVSLSIMAHPSRTAWVDELRSQIGPHPVAWDRIGNEWDTGSRAWQLHNPRADWHIVLQDDIIPEPNFLHRAEQALAEAHDGPVSFYLGTGRPLPTMTRAAIENARDGWAVLPWCLWGPAIALPTSHINWMLDACETGHVEYDRRISHWYESNNIPTIYTWPCLVDHRDEGSLLGNDTGVERRAWRATTS